MRAFTAKQLARVVAMLSALAGVWVVGGAPVWEYF